MACMFEGAIVIWSVCVCVVELEDNKKSIDGSTEVFEQNLYQNEGLDSYGMSSRSTRLVCRA
jgi:hypothetical protein